MPPSGIRITLELAGTSTERFRTEAAIPLLTSLHRQLDSEARETFVASVTVVPAGSGTPARPPLRRALRQAKPGQPVQLPQGPEWLEVVVIAGGPQPLEMYSAAEAALKCVPSALPALLCAFPPAAAGLVMRQHLIHTTLCCGVPTDAGAKRWLAC